eukprot:s98_g1.t1
MLRCAFWKLPSVGTWYTPHVMGIAGVCNKVQAVATTSWFDDVLNRQPTTFSPIFSTVPQGGQPADAAETGQAESATETEEKTAGPETGFFASIFGDLLVGAWPQDLGPLPRRAAERRRASSRTPSPHGAPGE